MRFHTRGVVLTWLAACGSGTSPKGTPVEPPQPVVATPVPVDAPPPPPDAPEPKKLACESGLAPTPAPAPDPTWFCARPDGTKHGPFLTLFPDGAIQISGAYKDGALDGHWERHRPDGSLAEDGQYAAGVKDGRWRQLGPTGATLGEYELVAGSGIEKRWLEDGKLYSETTLDKGLANGPAKIYASDGSVAVTARYTAGKLDGAHAFGNKSMMRMEESFGAGVRRGPRQIWQFNVLVAEENYDKKGRLDGPYVLWRRPHVARAKGQFDGGRRTGTWVWADGDNHKTREGTYVGGKRDGLWQEWWEQRLVFTGNYKQGKPDGEFAYFALNGTELGRFTITGGTGTMLTFHTNKKPSTRQHLVNGVADGQYQELSYTGRVLVDGEYANGVKHGTWKELTSGGTPTLEQAWKKGKLDGTSKKFVDGKLSTESHFVDGRADGPYVEYRNGKPAVTGQFAGDARTGTWTHYDPDGSVILTATYKDGVLEGPYRQLVDGVVIEGTMVAGRRSGTWTVTDKAGAVSKLTYQSP